MTKRPDEVLDYVFDFSRWLSSGDTIASVTGSISSTPPAGAVATAAIDSTSNTGTTATAWVSAGIDGETAEVKVKAVTTLGRTKDACFRLRIKECC
ncbi:MAG: hypothetical protein GC182_08875 [Rhodopseudomonas sp.]|nr:hypothetical protein [Rhodopseudomonas sp.]